MIEEIEKNRQEYDVMEGGPGGGGFQPDDIPVEVKEIVRLGSYVISFGKDNKVYLETREYHPGYLCLSAASLLKLLKKIESQKECDEK